MWKLVGRQGHPPLPMKSRRRWLQFGLRTLLLATTILGIWFGFYMQRVRRQKEAVQAIREFGGWLHYGFQENPWRGRSRFDPSIEPPIPKWLVDCLGEDFFFDVIEVNLAYSYDSGKRQDNANVSDAALAHLLAFPNLRELFLKETQASDEGLRTIGKLKNLRLLFMWNATQVSDQGIAHLAGLSNLENIYVGNSRIGDDSLKVLGALPRLEQIDLRGTWLSDRGLAFLQASPRLRFLLVGDCDNSITDTGMRYLGRLKNLETLSLQKTKITSAGLDELKGLSKLKELNLRGTEADSTALQKAIPNCRIDY